MLLLQFFFFKFDRQHSTSFDVEFSALNNFFQSRLADSSKSVQCVLTLLDKRKFRKSKILKIIKAQF